MIVDRLLKPKDSILLLEDGTQFEGTAFGALASGTEVGFGEVIFNTAMAGYQEVLTDPSYTQQIVVMTYPHQGNYGIIETDNESLGRAKVSGFIVHEMSESPSNWASTMSLQKYLETNQIPALFGVDTRALTLHIRSKGAMRGLIFKKNQNVEKDFSKYPSYAGRDLILEVTTKKPYWFSEKGSKTVVALDFGVKLNLLRELAARGCKVMVLPANATSAEVLAHNPDGIFLSNGPGDPQLATYAVKTIKELLGKKPIFGVCMGHQLLGTALGAKTFKMKFGHRGVNQPVIDTDTKKVEISSHNHGYAVDPTTLPKSARMTHVNLNDACCEGLECKELNAFSVQYHPESAPGPHDSSYLFDRFTGLML